MFDVRGMHVLHVEVDDQQRLVLTVAFCTTRPA
jgi:hypothetical protein